MSLSKSTWLEVIEDMKYRNEDGREKYGKYLTPDSKDNMLQHLYEELLDASVYIKTLLIQQRIERAGSKQLDMFELESLVEAARYEC